MDYLSILGVFLAIPNILLTALSQLAFWQRKEYRLDRVLSTLYDNNRSLRQLYYIAPLTFFIIGYLFTLPALGILFHLSVLACYLPRTIKLGLFRPKWTQKAILLALLLFFGLFLYVPFLIFTPTNLAIRLSALVLLIFPLIPVLVYLTNTITNIKKKNTIKKAHSLRASLKELQVIGITGSYGKTTTKHFLSMIFPEAISSKEHRNSDYVIAVDMLEQLTSAVKRYIVEMSAYKKGEIADLTALTSPTIGVLTHIGNQHLSLFGSQEKLTNAKWELIDSLPNDGIAVLNADDDLIVKKSKSHQGTIKWFSLQKQVDVYASNIIIKPTTMEFTLFIANNPHPLSLNLLSEAYLSSILAAACVAHAIGISDTEIIAGINKLKPLPRTMQLVSGLKGASIIDDSYSAGEQAVINAIKHLQRFPNKDKRIIMVPLIELGNQSKRIHERIGKLLTTSNFQIYIYGQAFHRQLNQKAFTNPEKLLQTISSDLTADSVVLLEGRIPAIIRKKLIAK